MLLPLATAVRALVIIPAGRGAGLVRPPRRVKARILGSASVVEVTSSLTDKDLRQSRSSRFTFHQDCAGRPHFLEFTSPADSRMFIWLSASSKEPSSILVRAEHHDFRNPTTVR